MSKNSSLPYFITPHGGNPDKPLFVFLPGMDESGKELMSLQTAGLETAFDVRCFVIPPDNLTTWDELSQQVVTLIQAELEKAPRSIVYLCGESFGACIALQVALKVPQLWNRIILINPASSFHRVPWLNLGSLLFPLIPKLFYELFSFTALPFLAPLNRLDAASRQALLKSVQEAPPKIVNWRLTLLRDFHIDTTQLHLTVTQPVLLIASQGDLILPSVKEVQRLAQIFPNAQVVTIPGCGHACLVETGINLLQILQSENFWNFQPKTS